jgi:neutral ceramidase
MKFSIGSRDITPSFPVFQSGFGGRTRKSEGVLQPIYMKVALLQANKTVLIIAIDAMGADRSFVAGIKDALQERFGLAHDEVLINFSHAHSSISLTGLDVSLRSTIWSLSQDHVPAKESEKDFSVDEDYFRRLRDSLLEMVAHCYENLIEGELSIGSANSEFAISRRVPLGNGKTDFAPNPHATIDKELSVLKLTDTEGRIQGIVYCFGCHPTTLGETYKLANDFIGFTSAELEKSYPGATALFLQACGAELKPWATVGDGSFKSCSAEDVQAMGFVLATDVKQIIEAGNFTVVNCHFNTALYDCALPTGSDDIGFYREILERDEPDSFEHTSATLMMAARLDGTAKKAMPCFVAAWQLDPQTHLVAIESEVSTEYSLAIKNYFNKGNMVALGYSNGVTCYIPSRKMIGEGGYEAECNYFFGLEGRFLPEIEDILIGQVARLLHAVR